MASSWMVLCQIIGYVVPTCIILCGFWQSGPRRVILTLVKAGVLKTDVFYRFGVLPFQMIKNNRKGYQTLKLPKLLLAGCLWNSKIPGLVSEMQSHRLNTSDPWQYLIKPWHIYSSIGPWGVSLENKTSNNIFVPLMSPTAKTRVGCLDK